MSADGVILSGDPAQADARNRPDRPRNITIRLGFGEGNESGVTVAPAGPPTVNSVHYAVWGAWVENCMKVWVSKHTFCCRTPTKINETPMADL